MFERFRIRLHSFLIRRKKEPEFVNPYAPPGISVATQETKINPYMVEYGTKKKKTTREWIVGLFKKEKEPDIPDFTIGLQRRTTVVEQPAAIVVAKKKTPPLSHHMRLVIDDDVEYVASIIKHPTCRNCSERNMTQIERVCEGLKYTPPGASK